MMKDLMPRLLRKFVASSLRTLYPSSVEKNHHQCIPVVSTPPSPLPGARVLEPNQQSPLYDHRF